MLGSCQFWLHDFLPCSKSASGIGIGPNIDYSNYDFWWIFPEWWVSFLKNFSWILISFSKFYGKIGVISWLLFHLIWKNYVLYWDIDSKSWIVDFFTRFTHEKTPQNNFSRHFSVENNYVFLKNILTHCE